ncbi:tetratricopeptide repeat protein [Vibrio lentus]|uniref:MSHA biogenesis protein MshN n=1 Tax=Vibrio lentus TaxID=136468 RepID=A0AA45A6N0_9VIBR|nr:tetratricopeptide repeat protein [Vibrio lentus]MCB5357259.1 MSHA biogenesis protein MshN [Vibrio lentus]MCB5447727.1 MSHA biogenesis protein MshN [Vibrio lentus]MCB5459589.1 MSHA biogenesis protein MshN [Vibrio lentus]MCC4793787.1 tetratricopeptide repeat protein [Vibrio lentus]MCC4852884.1 tetratricopeptide repeat protein [Vibrio lentus]
MSVINNALSELAKKESTTSIEAAVVPKVKTRSPLVWVVGGFTLSLAMGGWAVSQAPKLDNPISVSAPQVEVSLVDSSGQANRVVTPAVPLSPTQKLIVVDSELTSVTPLSKVEKPQPSVTAQSSSKTTSVAEQSKYLTTPKAVSVAPQEPIYVANVSKQTPSSVNEQASVETPSASSESSAGNGMLIEQIELTSQQLSDNAVGRAQKALDANDLAGALKGYTEALRYAPRNEDVRQKLAILYFGKGDTRKAYELYQSGIKLNTNSEKLRLGLSKLLVKANQAEAALSPLVHLPPNPTKDYLAMRAALSQKSQQEEIALESYKKLVEVDSANARWWLGLAIQQERQLDFSAAKESYQGALTRVGISSQSQNFVRDRLKIIDALEENDDAN